jgi:hypothetical protein
VKDLVTVAPIEALYRLKQALPAAPPRELLICRKEYVAIGILCTILLVVRNSAIRTAGPGLQKNFHT